MQSPGHGDCKEHLQQLGTQALEPDTCRHLACDLEQSLGFCLYFIVHKMGEVTALV